MKKKEENKFECIIARVKWNGDGESRERKSFKESNEIIETD